VTASRESLFNPFCAIRAVTRPQQKYLINRDLDWSRPLSFSPRQPTAEPLSSSPHLELQRNLRSAVGCSEQRFTLCLHIAPIFTAGAKVQRFGRARHCSIESGMSLYDTRKSMGL